MSDTTSSPSPLPDLMDLAAVGKAIWWMLLLRGLFAILFGLLVILFPPGATLLALALFFAAFSLVDGAMTIAHAARIRRRSKRWGWLLLQGILSVLAGLVAGLFPVLAGFFGFLVVLFLIAFWSIFTGIAGFPAAHAMADGGRKVWAYIAAAASVLFGLGLAIITAVSPEDAVRSLIWVIGAYAIVSGVLLIVVAIGARTTATKLLAKTVAL
jgi:uncharacterized membrane protein HdeD (DUF308 family)